MEKRPKNRVISIREFFWGGWDASPPSKGPLILSKIAYIGQNVGAPRGRGGIPPPKKNFSDTYDPPRTCFWAIFPNKLLKTLPSGYCILLKGHFKPKNRGVHEGECAHCRTLFLSFFIFTGHI